MIENALNPDLGGQHIIGVVLAGGQSRRMGGGDKSLHAFGSSTFLANAVARLKPQVDHVIINANGDTDRFASYNLPIVSDTMGGYPGPLAGILAGFHYAAQFNAKTSYIATVACDTPFFPHTMIKQLSRVMHRKSNPIALASSMNQIHPTIGLWSVVLINDLERALKAGVRKVLDWAKHHDAAVVDFPVSKVGAIECDPFFNVNTPDDFQRAETILKNMQ